MSDYLMHFLSAATFWTGALTVLVAAGATWVARQRLGSRTRQLLFFAVVVVLGLILFVTLLREPPRELCWRCLAEPALWGDWGLSRLVGGVYDTEVQLNLALFVPLGLTATLLWKAPFRVAGVAVLLSALIELTQLLLQVGANDLLDVAANSLGALAGAGTAVLARLTWDAVRKRQFDGRRWAKLIVVIAVAIAVVVGGSAWGASSHQLAGVRQLEAMFAGTTLADHTRDHDSAWWPEREGFWRGNGMPHSDSYADEAVALDRYTWEFYLAIRCVTARWDAYGFSTILGSGRQCTQRLG